MSAAVLAATSGNQMPVSDELAKSLLQIGNKRVPRSLARVGRNHQRWYPVGHKSILDRILSAPDKAALDKLEEGMNQSHVSPASKTRRRWEMALNKRRSQVS